MDQQEIRKKKREQVKTQDYQQEKKKNQEEEGCPQKIEKKEMTYTKKQKTLVEYSDQNQQQKQLKSRNKESYAHQTEHSLTDKLFQSQDANTYILSDADSNQ